MSTSYRVPPIQLVAAACALLAGCSSSSSSGTSSGQDATADIATIDVGAEGSLDVLGSDVATPAEAGGPCASNADCDRLQGILCGFPVDGGCSASGVCIYVSTGGCLCDAGGALVCNCAGQLVAPSCCFAQGYQPFPTAPSNSCVTDGGAESGGDGATDAIAD